MRPENRFHNPMEQNLYDIVLIIAAGFNLVMAFALVHNSLWFREYDVYRRSRLFSALVFVAFAVGFLLHSHYQWRASWPEAASALSVSYFHVGAVFFGWSHTSLMRPDYLTRCIVVRDLSILVVGIVACWLSAMGRLAILHSEFSIFFVHSTYIAYVFYRTYFRVRRSLSDRTADDNAPRWWTAEAKREVLMSHNSFVIGGNLIILFGIGSIVFTAALPHAIWPYTVLLAVGTVVFCYIFYALEDYGNIIDAATHATEDAVSK